jgi:tRNA (adenine57-N1/adenine58-N1)-methyltransferase
MTSESTGLRRQSGPFRAGDRVQLTGPKGRMNTITLETDGEFHTHRGVLKHNEVIGRPDASVVLSTNEIEYLALRPLLTDFVMSMPRGAAIIYPKDAAQILAQADIFPGATVVEAGVRASAATSRHSHGDLAETLPEVAAAGTVDRIVLDMLAPWECLDVAADALTPGGVIICYIATVTQLSRVSEALRRTGQFTNPESSETMIRGWHVEGLAVRPDHRMIGHTGFLLTARRLAPGTILPELKRRASKSDFSDEDVEAWTPGSLGERSSSDKRLRKTARHAQAVADAAVAAAAGESVDE